MPSPEQSRTIDVGSRAVTVEGTPVPAESSATFRTTRLCHAGPDCLVLKPSLAVYAFGVLLLVFAVVVFAMPFFVRWSLPRDWWGIAFRAFFVAGFQGTCWVLGLACLIGGLLCLLAPRYIRFDRASGTMTDRIRGSRRSTCPLSDILAVQVIPGYVERWSEADTYAFGGYQLNLVLDDVAHPRLNISNHADLEGTRRMGRQLADFLGVALVDQVKVTPGREVLEGDAP